MIVQQAWYKQFWPWFLIAIPFCSMISSFTILTFAISTPDALVADEYYKEGKAINIDLAKINYAKQLGMQFDLMQQNNEITITQHGGPTYNTALNVHFYHPTLASRDIKLVATTDAAGIYRMALPKTLNGEWEIHLESYDQQWRIHKRADLRDNVHLWLN